MGACLASLVGVALINSNAPTAGLLKYNQRFQPEFVVGLDRFTRRNALLLELGVISQHGKYFVPEHMGASSPEAVALYGQACPQPDLGKLSEKTPPSTALLPSPAEKLPSGITVVSLVCDSDELFNPVDGIVTFPMARGQYSERPAWVSAALDSRLLLETPVGLRIHGGHSRMDPNKSFSIVFRKDFQGSPVSEPGLFFGPDTPPQRQVILLNAAEPFRFLSAMGTEIAAQIGCKTSRMTPAIIYLNGTRLQAPFFLYEQQSPDFVQHRFDVKDIEWLRLKSPRFAESEAYENMRHWVRKPRPPMTYQRAASFYDLNDLCAWVLAMTYTITTDNDQGGYFKDKLKPQAIWQSLTWDMDGAFNLSVSQHGSSRDLYFDDPFAVLSGFRAKLFMRLFNESPEFRQFYAKFVRETLATKLTPNYLMGLSDRYLDLAQKAPSTHPEMVSIIEKVKIFLRDRNEAYLKLIAKKLEAVPP